jgi:tRNA(Ile2) C34 agmatinyltransferase TiaS
MGTAEWEELGANDLRCPECGTELWNIRVPLEIRREGGS